MLPRARIATVVERAVAPGWLTCDETCFFSGYDHHPLQMTTDIRDADLDNAGRLERESIWDLLEAGVLVRHWND